MKDTVKAFVIIAAAIAWGYVLGLVVAALLPRSFV